MAGGLLPLTAALLAAGPLEPLAVEAEAAVVGVEGDLGAAGGDDVASARGVLADLADGLAVGKGVGGGSSLAT